MSLVSRGEKAINERYRPMRFSEIIGCDKTKQALTKWMERGKLRSRAILLYGESGCGKSTLSRIIAMGLNCEKGDTVEPCLECPSCKAAMTGEAMHIQEYNMSALTRKEDADEIINSLSDSCFTGRNKMLILDECLHYDTLIDCFVDGKVKRIKIGNIVHNKMNVDVLSYNKEKEIIEIKPVVNWFKNPKKEVFEWVFERIETPCIHSSNKKVLTCTDNHTVFLRDSGEEVQIGTLKHGDMIRGNCVSDGKNYVEVGYRFLEKRVNPNKNLRGNVYDIEVKDNHNYFASGINVHNCQGMSTSSQNLILKSLENPPPNTYLILCTTNPEKLLKTVRNRCEQYEFKNPTYDDIKIVLGNIVKQEMPEMNLSQRKEILEACRGLSYREILMKLEKFIKGGGTDSISEAFQANYFDFCKLVAYGKFREAMEYIDKNEDDFDIESARRMMRTYFCNAMVSASKTNDLSVHKYYLMCRIFDKGFYTDPNPMPSFKMDVYEACQIMIKNYG